MVAYAAGAQTDVEYAAISSTGVYYAVGDGGNGLYLLCKRYMDRIAEVPPLRDLCLQRWQ